ncbi:uncharacterized protein LOC141528920 [Cotesia typhae]|uniref:uncharacterized protein LOC141528920 n=1 Tax=Cotesia typhae TaxID=2053667 RepID=UPI003D688DBB
MYELNRRFIFVVRVLGLGLAGCKKFCGLMDLSSSFSNQSTYDFYINKIHECFTIVTEKLFSSAATEEKQLTSLANNMEYTTDVTVSGDGTWKKRGFASLYGIINEGISALLSIMHGMDLKLGSNSHEYARNMDENRVTAAEKKSTSETREARIRHRLDTEGCPEHCSCSRFSTLWPRNRRFNMILKEVLLITRRHLFSEELPEMAS